MEKIAKTKKTKFNSTLMCCHEPLQWWDEKNLICPICKKIFDKYDLIKTFYPNKINKKNQYYQDRYNNNKEYYKIKNAEYRKKKKLMTPMQPTPTPTP